MVAIGSMQVRILMQGSPTEQAGWRHMGAVVHATRAGAQQYHVSASTLAE